MALIGLCDHFVGDEFATFGLRDSLPNRHSGCIVQMHNGRVGASHRQHDGRNRFLILVGKVPHFGDCLLKKLGHGDIDRRLALKGSSIN